MHFAMGVTVGGGGLSKVTHFPGRRFGHPGLLSLWRLLPPPP